MMRRSSSGFWWIFPLMMILAGIVILGLLLREVLG